MPVALLVQGRRPRRVPIVRDEIRLGRGVDVDVRVEDDRAAPFHARIHLRTGEYLLGGNAGELVYVNGKRVPLMALRHGDEVRLVEPELGDATTLVFENRLGEAFVPPGASQAAAWMAHAAFRDPRYGPDRYGPGQAFGGRDRARCRLVREEGSVRRLLVKILGPVRTPQAGDDHLGLLAALAGAPHDALVPVVDGGHSLPARTVPCGGRPRLGGGHQPAGPTRRRRARWRRSSRCACSATWRPAWRGSTDAA